MTGPGPGERTSLRTTFDSAAASYQEARPEYPSALFEELLALTRVRPPDHLVEIGCATGKATLPLARRGFRITCLEIGPALVAEARRLLAPFPLVKVVEADFETWRPPHDDDAALVFAATSWHWIDPAVRYRRAWQLLRPGGHLAFWSATHVQPVDGDPFFDEIQEVYEEIGEGLPPDAERPLPGRLPEETAAITATGLFDDVRTRQFDWEVRYSADGYLRLLDTFSGHIAMSEAQRSRLYGEIRRRLAARPDGSLRRHWGAVLHVARRRSVTLPD